MKIFSDRTKLLRIGRYALIVLCFALIATLYFTPATFEGRTLYRQDVEGAVGMGTDARKFYEKTGERSYWTNSMFGGMPMYQIAPEYPSTNALSTIQGAYTLSKPLNLLGDYPWLLFGLLIGFFILMKVLRVNDWIDPYFRRAYLEAYDSYVHTAYHSRHDIDLSRKKMVGGVPVSSIHSTASTKQPCTDDLLLSLCDGSPCHSIPCGGDPKENI